ncbi:MAG TPA: hypothetical protein VHA37_00685, partial [Candidatus Saccharimonadales bacterium]|nr:hypothetical protein [Candidatus Saccharimonadales bacterium]
SPMDLPPLPNSAAAGAAGANDGNAAADDPLTQQLASTVVDDGDVVEKDWVDKARRIVQANRNDPYKQSEELTLFRAAYMKKRFGKDIKLGT